MADLKDLTLKIYNSHFLPLIFKDTKIKHYKKIFGDDYKEVYKESNNSNPKEKTFILSHKSNLVARCVAEYNKYDLRIRDFTVLSQFREKGIATYFMNLLEKEAMEHHFELLKKKEKYYNIMFLKTYIYLDGNLPGEEFEMGKFLKKQFFKPYKYNPKTLSEEEKKALEIYTKINFGYKEQLKVFKKELISNITLKEEISRELQRLDDKKVEIVLKGLDAKLNCYEKRGFVSYKYSVCPVCNDMKSSLEESSNCENCYIQNTCLEPFREGFKEDNEISYKYFSYIEWFIKYPKNNDIGELL